eukprot:605595_1
MQLYLPTNLTKRYIINVLNDSCYSNHPCKFQYGGCWYGFQGAGCGYQHILYEPAMDIIPPIHCQNEPQHNQIPPYNPRQVQLNPVANPPQIPQQNAPNKPHNIRKTKTRSKRGKTPPLTANNSPNSPHNTKEIEVTVTPSKSTAYAPKLTASAPTFIPQTECKDATTNTASKPLVSQPDTTPKSRSKRSQNAPSYSSSDDDDDPQSKPQQLPHPKQQASGDIHLGQEEECTVNATALSHATSPGIAVESKTHDMEKKKQNIPPQYIPPQQHVKRSIEGDRTQQTTAKPPSKSQQSTPQKQPPKKKKKKKKAKANRFAGAFGNLYDESNKQTQNKKKQKLPRKKQNKKQNKKQKQKQSQRNTTSNSPRQMPSNPTPKSPQTRSNTRDECKDNLSDDDGDFEQQSRHKRKSNRFRGIVDDLCEEYSGNFSFTLTDKELEQNAKEYKNPILKLNTNETDTVNERVIKEYSDYCKQNYITNQCHPFYFLNYVIKRCKKSDLKELYYHNMKARIQQIYPQESNTVDPITTDDTLITLIQIGFALFDEVKAEYTCDILFES